MTENEKLTPVPLADAIDNFIKRIGMSVAWVYVVLVLVIMLQVILRKGFASGLIALEELQWHLYSIGVMFGLSYAQTTNSHIRVDLFYSRLRAKTKRIIEVISIPTMVLPFIVIIFLQGIDFTAESYRVNEASEAASGLPYRWAMKSVIPISFALLGLAVISRFIRDITLLIKGDD
ncbi:TRAP transporter small permease subunit [Neptuniibacter caesariensis]|uniref:TRAP transporter small permease protein n=1 Tax=Neptuniibacter caesariensis TaxID=207954 RepID=A0A7U8GS01_NEPCE|nr:TRAP transporter small permease subunit [Neptuniibacter caesariensis]EAR60793.1 C4-dicarboxylate transporter family protein, DctQ subunit [Oceanospirillum sp. MED92] [Neptuniibacter caesariensis]